MARRDTSAAARKGPPYARNAGGPEGPPYLPIAIGGCPAAFRFAFSAGKSTVVILFHFAITAAL
jgi:hypothetical protein